MRNDRTRRLAANALTRRAAFCAGFLLIAAACQPAAEQREIDRSVADATPAAPAAPAPAAAASRSCGVSAATLLTDAGIGDLRIGLPVSRLAEECAVLSDTTRPGAEGMPAHIVTVDLGRDTVEVEVSDQRVWRIALEDGAFRTADSLGVGTPLTDLLHFAGVHGMPGEDGFYVQIPEHCGLSFRLSNASSGFTAPNWNAERLRTLPSSARVERVLVVGCAD
jgi:hypothetical protein